MKVVITGANGTVGSALSSYLKKQRAQVVAWDRNSVSIQDYDAMYAFLQAEQPHILFHLATASQTTGIENESWLVNYEWTGQLAWITKLLGIKLLFTSSVMVFTNDAKGPFTLDSQPDAQEGYGYEKRMAERYVLDQNSNAIIARLGWQIGETAGSNNMVDFLEKQMTYHSQINASRRWLPACSFLEDSVAALVAICMGLPGLYMLDSNPAFTFYEIVQALNQLHGGRWNVVPTDDFVYDQRMIDRRVPIPPLTHRLPQLETVAAKNQTATKPLEPPAGPSGHAGK